MENFKGAAKRLDKIDIPRIAHDLGIDEDILHGFTEVEAPRSGFDSQGRPRILFEPHKFWANLPKGLRPRAQALGLASPKWGTIPYGSESNQYARLSQAMEIHPEAALKSCSWGRMQIMGENHRMAGFDTVFEMVNAFKEDEQSHIEAGVEFLKTADLVDELKELNKKVSRGIPVAARDCAALARGYNGSGYAKHNYHGRIAAAINKWSAVEDYKGPLPTDPIEPPAVVQPGAFTPTEGRKPRPGKEYAEELLTPFEVESIQRRLRELGYFMVGKVDKAWGPATRAAITALQTQAKEGTPDKPGDTSIVIDGHWGPQTRMLLADDSNKRYISPARANTTVQDLREQGSTTIKDADKSEALTKITGFGAAAAAVVAAVRDALGQAGDTVTQALSIMPLWAWCALIAVAALVYVLYQTKYLKDIKRARLEAEQTGLHNGEAEPAPPQEPVEPPTRRQGLPNVRLGRRRN